MLNNFDLKETKADSCVFISKRNNHLLIVAIFVDDGLIAATTDEQVNDLVRCLKDNFETKESDLDQFLGIGVNRKIDGSIFIHQTSYCERIISKFNMESANVVHIPTDPQHILDSTMLKTESIQAEGVPYREAVGSLLYLSQITRPNITFAVNLVSRYLEKPQKVHWNAVKRIFKYLKSSLNYGLLYSNDININVFGYSDADYAGDAITRRSTSGVMFCVGKGLVAWSSQRQK